MLWVIQIQDLRRAVVFAPIAKHYAGLTGGNGLDFGSVGVAVDEHIDAVHLPSHLIHVHIYRLVSFASLAFTAFAAKEVAQFLLKGKRQAFQDAQ